MTTEKMESTELQARLQRAKDLSKAVASVIGNMEKLETVEDMRQVYLTVGALLGIEGNSETEPKEVLTGIEGLSFGKAITGEAK